MIRRYLLRYVRDLCAFLKAYALASAAIFPIILFTYWGVFPFVYVVIGVIGLLEILIFSVFTSILPSYRLKLFVFGVALGFAVFSLWGMLSAEPIIVGAMNINRLIFAQLMFLFPIFYVLLERQEMREHFMRLCGPYDDDTRAVGPPLAVQARANRSG